MLTGRKGKCVNIKHFYGDQLWAAGTRDQLPDLGPTDLESLKLEEGSEAEDGEEEEDEKEDVDVKENDVDVNDECDVETVIEQAENLSVRAEDPVVDERSPQEIMDEMLENSLLQCLKTSFSQKKSEFPILTSNLFRVHMVSASPPGSTLDIKKSSYKKLSKYLNQKENEGLLQIKELAKGVESVVSVNYDHELLQHFRVVKYEKIEEPETEKDDEPCEVKYEPPVIEELVTVTANVLKLFKFAEISKGETQIYYFFKYSSLNFRLRFDSERCEEGDDQLRQDQQSHLGQRAGPGQAGQFTLRDLLRQDRGEVGGAPAGDYEQDVPRLLSPVWWEAAHGIQGETGLH